MPSVNLIKNRFCPVCGEKFYASPKRLIRSKGVLYCSRECQKNDPKNGLKLANRHCKRCGKPFYAKRVDTERGYGHYCSKSCSSLSTVPRGKNHSRYRGEMNNHGYIYSVAPEGHPRATKHGYIAKHTLIMETHLGRYLVADEVVHHINGIRDDNRLENLQLMKVGEHHSYHSSSRIYTKLGQNMNCPICGIEFYRFPHSLQMTCSRKCGQVYRKLRYSEIT